MHATLLSEIAGGYLIAISLHVETHCIHIVYILTKNIWIESTCTCKRWLNGT